MISSKFDLLFLFLVFHQTVRSESSSSSSSSNSNSSSDENNAATGNQHRHAPTGNNDSPASLEYSAAQLDESFLSAETVAFHDILSQLRGIVGDDASDEALKDILLAADMDINRAVNFYFS